MDLIQTVLGFLLALFILVSVHEFGHFYVARLCGVKVLRFCIGMGKPIWSFRDKKGTEFGLAPIPLGGYVKMLDEREGDVPLTEKHLSYNSKSVWQRIAILSAGPLANFILAAIIFTAILLFMGTARIAPVVGVVQAGSLAEQAGLEVGQEIVAVDGVPTPTAKHVFERLFMRLGETGVLELSVRQPGSDLDYDVDIPLNNWMSDVRDPDPASGLGFDFYVRPIMFGQPQMDSPAEKAGLAPGDIFIGVNGESIETPDRLIQIIRASAGVALQFSIRRNNQSLSFSVTPESRLLEDGTRVGQIGIPLGYGPYPQELIIRQEYGVLHAIGIGLQRTLETSKFVLVSLKKLLVGEISTKNLSGPIGIAKVAGDHAKAGFIYFVEFLAILSVYLGVLNLLPIPVLDGGHILYSIVEAIKGSPLSQRVQMFGYSVGLVVLIGVMIMAFYNDLLRL